MRFFIIFFLSLNFVTATVSIAQVVSSADLILYAEFH